MFFASPDTHTWQEIKQLVDTPHGYGLEVSEDVVQKDLVLFDEDLRHSNIELIKHCIHAYSEVGINTINLFTGPCPWIPNPLVIDRKQAKRFSVTCPVFTDIDDVLAATHPENSIYKGDAAGSCIFEMSDGSVFVYNCILGAYGDDCLTTWESTWRVYGSKGSAVWDGKFQHAGCIEEMFEAFAAGRNPQPTARTTTKVCQWSLRLLKVPPKDKRFAYWMMIFDQSISSGWLIPDWLTNLSP